MKANKYKEIYSAFMKLGFILEAQTFSEIASADLFPDSDSMLLLERKYADILKDEDMTGIPARTKKKNKMKSERINMNASLNSINSLDSAGSFGSTTSLDSSKSKNKKKSKNTKTTKNSQNKSNIKISDGSDMNSNNLNSSSNINLSNLKPKLDSRNYKFIEYNNLKNSKMKKKISIKKIWN